MYNNGNSSKNVTGSSVVDGTLENADFADNTISGDKIDGGVISMFQSTGIDDRLSTAKAITIDASEKVLIGKATAGYGSAGAELSTIGAALTRDGGGPLLLNRLTSYGDIVAFRKDSSTQGNIGSSTSGLYIHSTFGTDSGLVFGAERIVSCTSTGDFEDGLVDLGYGPSGRFKDLYLSGNADIEGNLVIGTSGKGIDFSGVGTAANILDDYEEGTWTPAVDGTTTGTPTYSASPTGTYIKTGNQVTVHFSYTITAHTGSGTLRLNGLPFTSATPSIGALMLTTFTFSAGYTNIICYTVGSHIRFYAIGTGASWRDAPLDVAHGVQGTVTYSV
jgi:hypothetical protein